MLSFIISSIHYGYLFIYNPLLMCSTSFTFSLSSLTNLSVWFTYMFHMSCRAGGRGFHQLWLVVWWNVGAGEDVFLCIWCRRLHQWGDIFCIGLLHMGSIMDSMFYIISSLIHDMLLNVCNITGITFIPWLWVRNPVPMLLAGGWGGFLSMLIEGEGDWDLCPQMLQLFIDPFFIHGSDNMSCVLLKVAWLMVTTAS